MSSLITVISPKGTIRPGVEYAIDNLNVKFPKGWKTLEVEVLDESRIRVKEQSLFDTITFVDDRCFKIISKSEIL